MTLTQQRSYSAPATAPGRRLAPATARRPLDGADAGVGRVITFEGGSNTVNLLDTFLMGPYLDGTQPFARSQRLDRVRDDATLVPPDTTPSRSAVVDGTTAHLVLGDGWTLLCLRWTSGGGHVEVVAATDELARSVLQQATDGAADELEPDDPRVEIGFWHWAGNHARRRELPIAAEPWLDIRRNYASAAAAAVDELVALDGSAINGRILLVHGPPGTGKTTALRSLAKQWRDWCQLDFVVDPERLFMSPGYLIDVVMGGDDDKPWRMLLLEDCDELIRPGAKASAGQALSRLLNLTDGLLGQGRKVLVAITTNEDITRLHPAVTRPGRCLAQIEFGRLPCDQATAWLAEASTVPATRAIGAEGATLAELIALRDGTMPVGTREAEPTAGLYL